MNDTLLVKEINLKIIIERRILFIKENSIFDKNEYEYINKGEILAYKEMLDNIEQMTIKDFTLKYTRRIKEINMKLEQRLDISETECEKLSGYNNAVVFVLGLINPIYEYDV